ncbi:MAG: carboxyltransferase domain-containing protein [Albidovulum sp.]
MPSDVETIRPEILSLGQYGVLVRFSLRPTPAAIAAVQAFHARLAQTQIYGVIEIAPSLTSLLVRFDPTLSTRDNIEMALRPILTEQDWGASCAPAPTRRWSIPFAFGGSAGPQLAEAAQIAGVSETQAIKDVTSADLRVLAIGFAPGQPYLGLLRDIWDMPRQPRLTPQVPAGALVVAVRQLVIFSAPNATGWRQIGLTAFRPFQPDSPTPFPLFPGDAIRIVQIAESEMSGLGDTHMGGARCEVLT